MIYQKILHFLKKQVIPVIFLLILIFTAMVFFIWKNIELEQDVTKLTSDKSSQLTILKDTGFLDRILIDISLDDADHLNENPDRPNQTKLMEITDRIALYLEKSQLFSKIQYKMNMSDFARFSQLVADKGFSYIHHEDFDWDSLNKEDVIKSNLTKIKFRLLSFDSLGTKSILTSDPFGLTARALSKVFKQTITYKANYKNGYIFSRDNKHILIICKLAGKAFDLKSGRQIKALATDISQKFSPAIIKVLGGPVYTYYSARLIMNDTTFISICSLLGIIVLFLFSFKNIKILIFCLLSIGTGFIAGIFTITSVYKSIHGITLVFGTMLIGIGIDYSVHYFVGLFYKKDPIQTITSIFRSLLFGYLTTVAIVIVFLFSNFRFFKEIAIFFFAGISTCFLFSVLFLPLFFTFADSPKYLSEKAKTGPFISYSYLLLQKLTNHLLQKKHLLFIILFCVLILTVSGFAAFKTKFDSDIRNLNYRQKDLIKLESEFIDRYGDISASNLVIIKTKDLDKALYFNDQVYRIFSWAQNQGLIDSFFNIHRFLPSEQFQIANMQKIASYPWNNIQKKVETISSQMGFKKNTYNPFFQKISNIRNNKYHTLHLDDLQQTPINELINDFILVEQDSVIIISYFRSKEEIKDLKPLIDRIDKIDPENSRVQFINQVHLINNIMNDLIKEIRWLTIITLLVIAIILYFHYFHFLHCLLALLPTIAGLVITLGVLALLNIKLNIMSIFSLVFIIGIGLDYGIFMLDSYLKKEADRHTAIAVLIAAITTFFTFGILILSKNNALSAIGLTLFSGIVSSMLFAVFIIPILVTFTRKRK